MFGKEEDNTTKDALKDDSKKGNGKKINLTKKVTSGADAMTKKKKSDKKKSSSLSSRNRETTVQNESHPGHRPELNPTFAIPGSEASSITYIHFPNLNDLPFCLDQIGSNNFDTNNYHIKKLAEIMATCYVQSKESHIKILKLDKTLECALHSLNYPQLQVFNALLNHDAIQYLFLSDFSILLSNEEPSLKTYIHCLLIKVPPCDTPPRYYTPSKSSTESRDFSERSPTKLPHRMPTSLLPEITGRPAPFFSTEPMVDIRFTNPFSDDFETQYQYTELPPLVYPSLASLTSSSVDVDINSSNPFWDESIADRGIVVNPIKPAPIKPLATKELAITPTKKNAKSAPALFTPTKHFRQGPSLFRATLLKSVTDSPFKHVKLPPVNLSSVFEQVSSPLQTRTPPRLIAANKKPDPKQYDEDSSQSNEDFNFDQLLNPIDNYKIERQSKKRLCDGSIFSQRTSKLKAASLFSEAIKNPNVFIPKPMKIMMLDGNLRNSIQNIIDNHPDDLNQALNQSDNFQTVEALLQFLNRRDPISKLLKIFIDYRDERNTEEETHHKPGILQWTKTQKLDAVDFCIAILQGNDADITDVKNLGALKQGRIYRQLQEFMEENKGNFDIDGSTINSMDELFEACIAGSNLELSGTGNSI